MRTGLIALVLVLASASAHAEAIQARDMMFILPRIGHAWDQKTFGTEGKVIIDEPKAPNLTIVLLYPKKEGTLDQVLGAAEADLKASSIRLGGKPIQSFKAGKLAESTINAATVRMGDATLDGAPALLAALQRDKGSVVLVAIAKGDKAKEQFAAIVKSLEPPPKKTTPAPPPDTSDDVEPLPKLGAFAAVKDVSATSTYPDKSKKDLYGAWRVLEYELAGDPMQGIPKTAWCEGKPDEGVGEGITINLLAPTKIENLLIATGVWLTPKLHKANNQITSLAISLDGRAPKKVAAATEHGEWTEVPVGKAVSSIKITIDAVKKGKMNDSCISGVQLGGESISLGVVRGLDAAAVAALPAAYDAIAKAIASPSLAGLDKHLAFPFTYESSDWFFEDNHKPVKHASWKSIETACKKKKIGCPSGPHIGGRGDYDARVEGAGNGAVTITFPSGREVSDVWHLVWTKGAWKVTDMISGS